MSKFIGELRQPFNNTPIKIYKGFNWPCFFFGPLWFLGKSLWLWALGSAVLWFLTLGISQFVFPFFANKLYVKHLRSKGWSSEVPLNESALPSVYVPKSTTSLSTTVPPLAATDVQQPSDAAVVGDRTPDSAATSQLTAVDIQTSGNAGPTQPQSFEVGSLLSQSFIFAKVGNGVSWKNEYDVIDAEAGVQLFQVREAEISALGKVARMGTTATGTGFDIMFSAMDGQPCFRAKSDGGGITATGKGIDVWNSSNEFIGKIKQSGSLVSAVGCFDIFDSYGSVRIKTKAKGFGMIAGDTKIEIQGTGVGTIKVINKDEAKEILGSSFSGINVLRKYDYAYHLALSQQIDEADKALLMGAVYFIAHLSGRM